MTLFGIDRNHLIKSFFLIVLVLDLAYSFYQHYKMPVGGDIAQIVVPTPGHGYYQVLQDPLGFGVLLDNKIYSNPNRFFVHWIASSYFLHVPLFLQIMGFPDRQYLFLLCAGKACNSSSALIPLDIILWRT